MAEKEIGRNRLADGDVTLKMQFAPRLTANYLIGGYQLYFYKSCLRNLAFATKRISYFIFQSLNQIASKLLVRNDLVF